MGIEYVDVKADYKDWKEDNEDKVKQCKFGCCAFAVIFLIVLFANMFAKIASTEVGLAYSKIKCELKPEVLTEGLRMHPPFGNIIVWDAVYKTIEFSDNARISCNSKDGVLIQIDASFQYVPRKDKIYDLTKMYVTYDQYQNVVYYTARSSFRHGCRNVTALEFQTERSVVRKKMEDELISDINNLYSDVFDVQLRNIDRPNLYESAVEDKETARADIDLAENERLQKEVQAETSKEEAVKLAEQTADTARTQAEIALSFASNNAAAATNMWQETATIYRNAKTTHGFTTQGVLSYIANGIFGPKDRTRVSVDLPAQVSFKDEI